MLRVAVVREELAEWELSMQSVWSRRGSWPSF